MAQVATPRKRRSVHLLGYDIADREWATEQSRFAKVLESIPSGEARASSGGVRRRGSLGKLLAKEEHDAALRHALYSKLQSLDSSFSHHFTETVLGFSLALARYGDEGRYFLQVDATRPGCDLYPDVLKPHDELVAVNDTLVVSADLRRFQEVLQLLMSAPRPLKLTFVEGEGRDLAFQCQERQRRLDNRGLGKPEAIKPESEARRRRDAHSDGTALSRLTSAMDLDTLSKGFPSFFIKEDKEVEEKEERTRVEARHATVLPWCSVSCLGDTQLQIVETPDAQLRYDL